VPFLVEDGTGVPNATAYHDVTVADDYHADRGNAGWTGSDDVKGQAIIRATDYLRTYAGSWKGVKTYGDQGLDWPRAGVMLEPGDRYLLGAVMARPGVLIASSGGILTALLLRYDAVPLPLIFASCELALRALTKPLIRDLDRGRMIKSQTVGPISTTYMDGAPSGTVYPYINGLLRPYMQSSSTIEMRRA
jgi:hypothetical protein